MYLLEKAIKKERETEGDGDRVGNYMLSVHQNIFIKLSKILNPLKLN